jgi:hypothetical protein
MINVEAMNHYTALVAITWYVYLYRNWLPLQIVTLVAVVSCFIFIFCYFEESPKFLYTKRRFAESKEALKKIAEFNGVQNFDIAFKFDDEVSEHFDDATAHES